MRAGALVADRFVIVRLAGRGGMGAVYQAHDRETNRLVALKMLAVDNDDSLERFGKEGAVLATLDHPGIVRYVAHGSSADGTPYMAMDWIAGETLSERLKRAPPTQAESMELAERIASALGYAHARGIVHRDVKPGNIVLAEQDVTRPLLIDFGLVRVRHSEQTRVGMAVGTPSYMAPEQARCAPDLDARADVFSLGCVLFKCLTGRLPFEGPDALTVLSKILFDDAPRARAVSPSIRGEVDDLVASMLAKDRAARPENGDDVARRLHALGTKGTTRASTRPPARLTHGERRLLSILVADTRLPSQLDESGAMSRGPVLDRVREVTSAFAAHAEVLVDGSLVVSLSNRSGASELAMRAAACAVAMRAVLAHVPIVLATGTGLAAGEETPGTDAQGDVFRRASALVHAQAASFDADIVIDEVTARLVEERFVLANAGGATRLMGVRDDDDAPRRVLGHATPFVGREREVTALLGLVDEAFEEPRAMVALVTAPAGVGKSRLRAEVLRAARARHVDAEVLFARGDPVAGAAPFGLLAQMIKRAAGIRDGQPPAAKRRSLEAFVATRVNENAASVTAFLGELVGAPVADDVAPASLREARARALPMGDSMRRAFEDLIASTVARRPVLVVLEDLHGGDLPTVAALDAAMRDLLGCPLAVLAFARPEVLDTFPKLWADRGLHHIVLGPVPKGAAEKLVVELLGADATRERAAALVERSAGNAFFLEELVRATHAGNEELPDTVIAIVHARLERLEAGLRRTLRAASVFGETFWADGVACLLGDTDVDVHAQLDALAETELVARVWDSRVADEKELSFVHAIIREAAYASLTDDDRALGHKLAASWLIAHDASDAHTIAEHLERGGAPSLAVSWWMRAAENAVTGADFERALSAVSRGVSCGATGEALARLLLVRTEVWAWIGDYAQVKASSREALAVMPRSSDGWILAAARLMNGCLQSGERDDAIVWVERLCDAFLALPEPSARSVLALVRGADALMLTGMVQHAHRLRDHVAPAARTLGENFAAVRGQWAATKGLFEMFEAFDFGAAAESYRTAIAEFEACGDHRAVTRERSNWGYVLLRLGAPDAIDVLRATRTDALRLGLTSIASNASQNLALALGRAGRTDEAIALIDEAIVVGAAQSASLQRVWSVVYGAQLLVMARDWVEAERRARLAITGGTAASRMVASACLADALREQGRVDEAYNAAKAAEAALDSGELIDEGEELARLAFARAAMAANDVDAAKRAIRRAREVVLERANKIGDEAWRASFKQRVPEHATTLALAGEWLGDA